MRCLVCERYDDGAESRYKLAYDIKNVDGFSGTWFGILYSTVLVVYSCVFESKNS